MSFKVKKKDTHEVKVLKNFIIEFNPFYDDVVLKDSGSLSV